MAQRGSSPTVREGSDTEPHQAVGGEILSGALAVGAVADHLAQGQQEKRKKKAEPIVAIVFDVATKKVLAELTQKQLDKSTKRQRRTNREWDVFNQNVEKVNTAAEARFQANELPWLLKLLTGMAGDYPKLPMDRIIESIPDIINYNQMQKEIRRGVNRAAADRDQAIQHNCKEPTLPR
jgi:hypothetical protein